MEGGWGSYDSYNSFSNTAVRGSGGSEYYGLGIFARRDAGSGSYFEGSLRGGKSKFDFDSFVSGQNVSYESNPTYYGAHLGIGKIDKKANGSLDYYAKYFYTYQNGDNVTLTTGDKLDFGSADSSRVRLGVRFNNNRDSGKVNFFYGAAYEYEFDGKANGSTKGMTIDPPSLQGSTGILEIGFDYKTRADSQNSLRLGLNGYIGKREGLSGTLQFKRVF